MYTFAEITEDSFEIFKVKDDSVLEKIPSSKHLEHEIFRSNTRQTINIQVKSLR